MVGQRARIDNVEHRRKGGEEKKEESGDNTTKMRFPLSTRVQIEPNRVFRPIPSDSFMEITSSPF